MINQEQIKEMYKNDLQPQLQGMDEQRKYIKKWRIFAILLAILAFLSFQYWKNSGGWISITLIIIFVIAAVFCAIKAFIRFQTYKETFKKEVVTKIIQAINPDYQYNAMSHISESTYCNSEIFPQRPDRTKSDDLIKGRIEKTPFQFSELKTEEKHETRDDDGNSKTEWKTIFRGIFFTAEFNKNLGENLLFPKKIIQIYLGKKKTSIHISAV